MEKSENPLKNGNKIILSKSAFQDLAEMRVFKIGQPLIFAVSNPEGTKMPGKAIWCSLAGFEMKTDPQLQDVCHLPIWVMHSLFLTNGDQALISLKIPHNLRIANHIKLNCQHPEFMELKDHK